MSTNINCYQWRGDALTMQALFFLKSTNPSTMVYAEWGGIVGIYLSGMKATWKAQKWPIETTICFHSFGISLYCWSQHDGGNVEQRTLLRFPTKPYDAKS